MSTPLRILIVEDSKNDAELLLLTLQQDGLNSIFERVDTPEAMQAALDQKRWDVVISDYVMPGFSGPAALALLQKSALDLPFIMVSGQMGEDIVVEVMKAGAYDYILKDNLKRLASAVERALHEAKERQARKQAEKALQESERRYRILVEQASDGIFMADAQGNYLDVNTSGCVMLGYSRREILQLRISDLVPAEDLTAQPLALDKLLAGETMVNERRLKRKDGTLLPVEISAKMLPDGRLQAIVRDITRRKASEEKQAHLQNLLKAISQINELIVREKESQTMLQRAAEILHRTRGYDGLWLGLLDEAGQRVRSVATAGSMMAGQTVAFSLQEPGPAFYCVRSALNKGQPYLVKDTQQSNLCATCTFRAGLPHRGALAVPLLYHQQRYGALVVYTERVWAFGNDELELLSELSADLAIGLHAIEERQKRQAAEAGLRRRTGQLQTLLVAAQRLNTTLKVPAVLQTLVASAMELTEATAGAAGLMIDNQMVFKEYNAGGVIRPVDYRFGPGYGVPGLIIETRQPYFTNQAEQDPHIIPEIQQTLGFYNLADAPILSRSGELLGCFEIHNTRHKRPFDEQDIEVLQGLADLASVALENARLYEQARQEITERKQAEEAIRNIAIGVSSKFGEKFFDSIVKQFAKTLGADYTFIGELIEGNQKSIKTLSFCLDGDIAENFEYDLAYTPCENVMEEGVCSYASGIQQLFPKDILLREMRVEGYVGVPLFNTQNQATGIIAALFREPIKNTKFAESILKIFAAQTSAEIERKQAEEEVHRRNRELTLLNQIIAASVAGQEPEAVLKTACRELALAFDVPQAAAVLLNEAKVEGVVVAEYLTEGRPAAMGQTIPVKGNPSFQYLLTHKSPLAVAEAQNDPRLAPLHKLMRRRGTSSLLILPLIIKGEVVGSLGLDTIEPRHFSAGEVSLAGSVADQVAGALARARLDKKQRQLSAAIEQSAESVVITDANGRILYVNPAFEQTSGYNQAEAIGQNPRILKSDRQDAAFYRKMWKTISAGQVWHGRFTNKKKDGALYTEEATISPVRDESGTIINYVAVKRDITHELQLEQQYQHAQKMEAIGRLAGGIAHDFNNLLTAIMGYTGLSLATLSPEHPIYEDIQGIQNTAERAGGLTRQLLTFARRQIVEPQILDLNDLILHLDKMLRRIISEDIELVTLPAPELGQVKADPGQMEQVLLNLSVNARDAMPGGGKLTIETANVRLDANYARQHAEVIPGEYVMLAVSDTGMGMTEKVKTHIFEPFFTTKEAGKGTGLGLSTCFGIVKQSGGHIWAYSEVDQGTTLKIYLPRIEERVNSTSGRDKFGQLPPGTETVLLVEDEPSVRELASRTLGEQGYSVLEAANGEEALRLVREQVGKEIHLLLTDVVMPRMGGKELAGRLTALHPDLKVLFMSGYTDNTVVHNGVLETGIAFLQKPFSPETLARKVRAVLDK